MYFQHGDILLPIEDIELTINCKPRHRASKVYIETNNLDKYNRADSALIDLENGATVYANRLKIINHALGKIVIPTEEYDYDI